MSLNMNDTKQHKQKELLPIGPQRARMVQIIDLGQQNQRPYQGKAKAPAFEMYLTFEFPDHRIEVEGVSRPRWKSRRIKLSSHEKSTCLKWYNVLDPKNQFKGDWSKLLTTDCLVLITHDKGTGDNEGITYDRVSDIMPLMAGMDVPPLENDPALFELTDPDMTVWGKLPDWLQNIIKDNLHYDNSKLSAKLGGSTTWTARAEGDSPHDESGDKVSEEETVAYVQSTSSTVAEAADDNPF